MRTLKIFTYDQGLVLDGRYRRRKSSRAIIISEHKLLMVYSAVNEDYKFPGGGIKRGETLIQGMQREVKEECGAVGVLIDQPFGKIIEFRKPFETQYDVFQMNSYYFLCHLPPNLTLRPTQMDDYEIDLGFCPAWVNLIDALQQNQEVLKRDPSRIPRWTQRDTYILELLHQEKPN